jgi:CheY-like chemotaxis protein
MGPPVRGADIEMPAEDGYSLIRKVRALDIEAGGRIPAVAVTVMGGRRTGFNMHVPKPLDPGELIPIIASVVGRTPQARDGRAE